MHRGLRSGADRAVSGEQVEIAHLPRRFADEAQPIGRAAQEDVATDSITAEQPRARLAHRVEALKPELEPERDLLRARILLRILRQQQARFEEREPRGHDEIIGGDLELQRARFGEIGQIMLDQLQDRDLREIDLLRAGQVEQQVERSLPAVERQGQLIRLADRR